MEAKQVAIKKYEGGKDIIGISQLVPQRIYKTESIANKTVLILILVIGTVMHCQIVKSYQTDFSLSTDLVLVKDLL